MARNGSGTFVRAHDFTDDAAAAIKIRADRMDEEIDGIATALSASIANDGQTTILADLPMSTFKHTGVGNATARDQYVTVASLQDGSHNWVAAGGTADAITATYAPALTALVDGQLCYVRAASANATTTPTFTPNGLTAHTITKQGGAALVAGDIKGNLAEITLRYNLANTRWELLAPSMPYGATTGSGSVVLATSPTITTPTISGDITISGGGGIKTAGAEGAGVVTVKSAAANNATIYAMAGGGDNAAASGMSIGKNSSTSRSINAGGTINASGADYAEYETKAVDCGTVAKGQIIGFDADGKITDKFSTAISFGIKSTDPSYVGGDVWGSEDAIGMGRPPHPGNAPERQDQETDEDFAARQGEYQTALANFNSKMDTLNAALEVARVKVDRVAYCGKAPVNVVGAQPGDYIIAATGDNDSIIGQIVRGAPTLDQYLKAVGRVRCILPDGRATAAVIVQ